MRAGTEVIDDDRLRAPGGEGARQTARGLVVTGAVAGGEDEDARHGALSY